MAKSLRVLAARCSIDSPEPAPTYPPDYPVLTGGSPAPPSRRQRTPTSSSMRSRVSAPSMVFGQAASSRALAGAGR